MSDNVPVSAPNLGQYYRGHTPVKGSKHSGSQSASRPQSVLDIAGEWVMLRPKTAAAGRPGQLCEYSGAPSCFLCPWHKKGEGVCRQGDIYTLL